MSDVIIIIIIIIYVFNAKIHIKRSNQKRKVMDWGRLLTAGAA